MGDGAGNPPAFLTFSDGDVYVMPIKGKDAFERVDTVYYLHGNIYETNLGIDTPVPYNQKIVDIMKQADLSKFSEGVDVFKLRKIIDFTVEGLMTERFREQAFDVEKLMDEVMEYFAMLKKLTYK